MSVRTNTRQKGDHDYSNIGISGRRTGLVLPQGRLDDNGIEEISGIFSSPRKPSPLKKMSNVQDFDNTEEADNSITPKQPRSTRKAPLRSASPRKSGISGNARRSTAVDILNQNSAKQNQILSPKGNSKIPAPVLRSGLRDGSPVVEQEEGKRSVPLSSKHNASIGTSGDQDELNRVGSTHHFPSSPSRSLNFDDEPLPPMNNDEDYFEDSEIHTTNVENSTIQQKRQPTTANSTRKRKSDATEPDYEPEVASSPAAKRAKRISDENAQTSAREKSAISHNAGDVGKIPNPKRVDPQKKTMGSTMSTQQQNELDEMVKKIRSRPGEKKSLYILKREGRESNTVLTRSGRVSVKPLAYWRNERCVYGGSPSGATLADGARFPLNSIKEIIRTEENIKQRSKKGKPQKKQKNGASRRTQSPDEVAEILKSSDEEGEDPDADPWETEVGTIRGPVAIWDHEQQTGIQEEEEVDIAYAAGAIETRDVKGSDFKYAKLYSSSFFGSGLVVLPPGAVKRPKNSKKMQMSFFVAEGRVTVSVGSIEGAENSFSIGKGGFWQVPRGNQYSIENKHSKSATIFFSQGCEPGPWDPEQ